MRIRRKINKGDWDKANDIAKISDALAHPVRVKIIEYVLEKNEAQKGVTNKELVEHLGYAQATISQHLNTLCSAGLMSKSTDKNFQGYFLHHGLMIKYSRWIQELAGRN